MAEVLAVVASVIAVIEISDRIIGLCKFYIESLTETPSSLRAVLIETSTLKTVFEALQFLEKCDHSMTDLWKQMSAPEGPIEGCRSAIAELEKLFPSESAQKGGQAAKASKRQKVQVAFATLAWPLKQSRVKGLLQQISNYKAVIQLALTTETSQDIKDIKATSEQIYAILTLTQRHDVCKWLVVTDPSPLHNRARKLYEPGTGSWMLRAPEWTDWLAGMNRCVWIHGIPGAGKTVLASWLIEEVQNHCKRSIQNTSICAYYYCYFGHNQDEAAPFLRWIISQLLRQAEAVPILVYDLFRRGEEPSIAELLDSLEKALQSWNMVYIVIDAIDESNPRIDLLEIIRNLVTSPRFSKIQMLITSREYIDIEREMNGITKSVSMSNPLIEQDIRLHVRSVLQSNMKFRHWSNYLVAEVEDAVSTQAKGMFRWAVCQLDELQRLKSERSIVRNALATLPKDLDETYERVFLRIPTEEWPFVCHIFYWFCFYREIDIHQDGIPCMLLLDAVRNSTTRTGHSNDSHFYDAERLKELCGCLINLGSGTSKNDTLVSFAHYTVKEYLDSTRVLQSPASFFSTQMSSIMPICLDVVLFQAQSVTSNDVEQLNMNTPNHTDMWCHLATVFRLHCAFCALRSMRILGHEICMNDNLFSLMKSLLRPSKQYFRWLGKSAVDADEFWFPLGQDIGTHGEAMLWTVVWKASATDIDAAVLLSLLLIADDTISCLTAKILREADLNTLLSRNLTLEKTMRIVEDSDEDGTGTGRFVDYEFSGSVIEVMSQLVDHHFDSFCFLLNNYTGFYDPSTILLHFIGHHEVRSGQQQPCDSESDCPVRALLEAGAEPNLSGYRVTPLQIAVAAWDLEGVRLLLEFGANPNGTGDSNGIVWPDNSAHARFNRLQGKSPLRICRAIECLHSVDDYKRVAREPALQPIEQLLLEFEATDFINVLN